MAPKIKNFRQLDVWKLGKEITIDIYKVSKRFPKEELFGLVAQMQRAAVPIPSNVAEGFNRLHNKEFRQYLFIALGSCAELETQLEISCELGFLKVESAKELLGKLDHESRMLRSLIKKLNVSTQS